MIVSDERVVAFVGGQVNSTIYPPWTAMGIEKDGEVVAGVVFNCFTGNDVEITLAGRGVFSDRAFLRAFGRYAFGALGCLRVSMTTEHQAVVDLALRCGAKVEGHKRNHFGLGRDAVLLGILKDDWKFK